MYGNLVVGFYQVDLREQTTPRKLVRVIMYVADGIVVWNSSGVQRSIVAAGSPTVILLGY
jgi:hypothetical protein